MVVLKVVRYLPPDALRDVYPPPPSPSLVSSPFCLSVQEGSIQTLESLPSEHAIGTQAVDQSSRVNPYALICM